MRFLLLLTLLLICLALNITSFERLTFEKKQLVIKNQINEALYLPKREALDLVSLGYKNTLANYIWFKTINYFGKHYRSDQDYRWLSHMCQIISDLDPKAKHIYEFCGLMLSWEGSDHKAALSILDKAIKNIPDFWRFYYLKAMTHMLFTKDAEQTRFNFAEGAKKPGAPSFMLEMATRRFVNSDNPYEAIKFLNEMISNTKEETQKAVLLKQLSETVHEIKLQELEKLVKNYKEKNGSLPKRLEDLTNSDLQDPFGGHYYLNLESGEVESTSHVPRKKLFHKDENQNGPQQGN